MTGHIYNIQRYSIHDGPGIRSTVFFKGCQLICPWCANPESQSADTELSFMSARCRGCGACENICPERAIHLENGFPVTDCEKCIQCGKCIRNCLNEARTLNGYEVTVAELADAVAKDMPFYEKSGGGVTASGGEPTLQIEFVAEFFKELKQRGIDTAIESHACFGRFERELLKDVTDHFLLDFKHSQGKEMERVCGMDNELAKENFRELTRHGKHVIMRIPTIPGFNDTVENMTDSAEFAKELGVEVCLLPFHAMAAVKYKALGRTYEFEGLKPPAQERMQEFLNIFTDMGVTAQIGG